MISRSVRAALCVAAVFSMAVAQGCSRSDTDPGRGKISDESFPVPSTGYDPMRYICRRSFERPVIDGRLDEESWNASNVEWTSGFGDIEGPGGPVPKFNTRAKMLWDGDYFYFGAMVTEPHIWATLTLRDTTIFMDNDFEIFIDPDRDTHEYYELEINAFGTQWDLLLIRPYRDGGPAVNAWDIGGLRTAVHVDGTINDPRDVDKGWSVEAAIPWEALGECAHRKTPPEEGDIWAVNFSRVEWDVEVEDGVYRKVTDPGTGRPVPEHNWVWSPQGIVNMHYPEMWGLVMFTNVAKSFGADSFNPAPEEQARWLLRRIYYAEKTHLMQYGVFTGDISRLGIENPDVYGYTWPPRIHFTPSLFEAVLKSGDATGDLRITQDGRVSSVDR